MDAPDQTSARLAAAHFGLGTAAMASALGGPIWCGPSDRVAAIDTVIAAAEAGVRFIDTAPFYGWGTAESIVAEALRHTSLRPPVLTKCGTIRNPDGTFREDASPAALRADVLASRDRLGVDRLDLVQIHDPNPETPIEASWQAMMTLIDEGVVAAAGLSNHDTTMMERARRIGPVAVVQHQYSLLHRVPEQDGTLQWARRHDVPFLAWSPLASGFLTDDFDLTVLAAGDHRHRLPWADDQRALGVRSRLEAIAERHGTSLVHIAVSWLVQRGATPIVGARTPSELTVHLRSPVALTAVESEDLGVPRQRES